MILRWTALSLVGLAPLALAWPDGAPPGHVGFDGQDDCGQCHYAGPPPDSLSGLEFVGFPDQVQQGELVEFVLRLIDTESRVAGFQILAVGSNDEPGEFVPREHQAIQTEDGRHYLGHTRPISSVPDDNHAVTEWTISWRAPDRPGRVRLLSAAVAADGDESALGDSPYRAVVDIEVDP